MLSNLEVSCSNLLILIAFMPSCTVWRNIPSSLSNLNIRDSLKFLHKNSVKDSIHSLAIERSYFFLRSLPLTNMSSGLLSSVFNGVPDSLINWFQEYFHPYFPISIIISIKVRRNNQKVSVFYDNRGQGSAQRSKDQKQKSYPLWYHLLVFRPFKTIGLT